MWHRDQITEGEIDALSQAARRAWAEDTRYPLSYIKTGDAGQCYVTSMWLKERLGGHVGKESYGGHYVWLAPEEDFILDLASHTGKTVYEKNSHYKAVDAPPNERTQRFARRANPIFEHLGKVLHLSLDYMGDALPGEEPQREDERAQQVKDNRDGYEQYWHDEPAWQPSQGEYKFVYANGQLEVSPFHPHDQLLAHTGVGKDHQGPMAMGHAMLHDNKATWSIESNMNVKGLDKLFKDYGKKVGWDWGGITNLEGEPISDDFAPKASSTLYWVYGEDEHLWIGHDTPSAIAIRTGSVGESASCGTVRLSGTRAYVSPVVPSSLPALYEWATDSGFRLYAENDNQLKVIPDLQQDNFYAEDPSEQHQYFKPPGEEEEPAGVYRCPVCQRLFPGWDEYSDHRKNAHGNAEINSEEEGHFPQVEDSAIQKTHFTPMQPEIMPVARSEAERVDLWDGLDQPGDQYFVAYEYGSPIGYSRIREGKVWTTATYSLTAKWRLEDKIVKYTDKQPKDLLAAPVPFIYDIQQDEITLGQPGQRTSDIAGRFTPGGIVEGVYQPGGKVLFTTSTNMPYSVRHVIDLWYYQHPELSVTSIYLQDQSGKKTKLAAEEGKDIGGFISSLVHADPAASAATRSLEADGGQVFAVGGAVRDALMGKQPKDIDLMVAGRTPAQVEASLRELPGSVNLTGKDFGVFRYRDNGEEVEIALPRRERSTGEGHRDFNVQADPHMSPQEDLWRRDFTANAMAVNLKNGELVDPYGGAKDIKEGVLRAHNPEAMQEDPLRVIRGLVANSRHGLHPDTATREQMGAAAPNIPALPQERVQQELDKLFAGDNPDQAIRLAHEVGALKHFLPEVDQTFGYDQNNPHHEYELGDHMLNVLKGVSELNKDPDVRLAALLHDIGKPGSQWTDPETGRSHFYKRKNPDGSFTGEQHEDLGADMTRSLMNRMRYPKDRTTRVTELVRNHMFPPFANQRGARKFLNRVGDNAEDLLDIRQADQGGKSDAPLVVDSGPNSLMKARGLDADVQAQRNLLEQVRNQQQPTTLSQLAVNGNDLLQAGLKGPAIGQMLNQLTEAVIDNPELNTKEQLLNIVHNGAA